jgi:CRISPR-associated protein Cas1
MIIEVTTHGSRIRRRRERFLIEQKPVEGKKKKYEEIPAEKVDSIIVTANAMISTQAVKLCIEKQIQLVLANYSGMPFARMWTSTPGRATEIRRKQYMNHNTNIAFDICKDIVLEKLKGQKNLLIDLKNNRQKTDKTKLLLDIQDVIKLQNNTMYKIKQMNWDDGDNFKQMLLGFEGSCASRYFSILSSCLPQKWKFQKRSQNPGLDPFNVALNYMYGIGYSTVEKIIILSGLDPNAGFYHADSYGKPTLSYDIIELCRPIIDRTLVSMFTHKKIQEAWFNAEVDGEYDIGMRIETEGKGSLLYAYRQENSNQIERISWDYCRKIINMLNNNNVMLRNNENEDGGVFKLVI